MSNFFVSTVERRLMLLLMVLVTCIYYSNLENKAIENYNQSVKNEQEKQKELANNPAQKDSISFGFSHCNGSYTFLYWLYGLQFFTNPLACFLLRKGTFKTFLAALMFNFATFICFVFWGYGTFTLYKVIERLPEEIQTFNQFVLYDSTKTEFTLAIFVGICFVVQMFVLLRFVTEKFRAKIALK